MLRTVDTNQPRQIPRRFGPSLVLELPFRVAHRAEGMRLSLGETVLGTVDSPEALDCATSQTLEMVNKALTEEEADVPVRRIGFR